MQPKLTNGTVFDDRASIPRAGETNVTSASGSWHRLQLALIGACFAALAALAAAAPSALAKAGDLDPSFGSNGRVVTPASLSEWDRLTARVQVAPGPNNTIVAAIGATVFRYLPNGSLDPNFGEGGKLTIADPEGLPFTLSDLAVGTDGRISLIGSVEVPDVSVPVTYIRSIRPPLAAVIRYTSDGKLDPTFGGGNGFLVTDFGQPSPYRPGYSYNKGLTHLTTGTIDRNGNLVAIASVGEIFTGFRSEVRMVSRLVVRLTPTGELDPSFGGGDGVVSEASLGTLSNLALDPNDALLVGGLQLNRLAPDGSVDQSFGRGGAPYPRFASLSGLAVDPFGRIVALIGRRLARFAPSGKLDRQFGERGSARVSLPGESSLTSLAVESSGRILLAGTQAIREGGSKARPRANYRRSFTVVRLSSHGDPDRRFGHHGWISTRFGTDSSALGQDAFIDPTDRLVVAGTVARPNSSPTDGIALTRYLLGG